MVHDDWTGTLVLNAPYQTLNAVEGSCTYTYHRFDGKYTGANGNTLSVSGTLGGKDLNSQSGALCKQSNHLISFNVGFAQPQKFVGYIFTNKGKVMTGYTWWQGITFGWLATKN